jgi:nitrate/nitrite transporter NarK
MKRVLCILLHFLLWCMVFYTFLNFQNALAGFPKHEGYNFLSDAGLYKKTLWTMVFLLIPFYFGYLTLPGLMDHLKRQKWLTSFLLFMIIYPVLVSVWDDGFLPGMIMQSVFLFAFLNLFLIMGLGVRSLFKLFQKTKKSALSENA